MNSGRTVFAQITDFLPLNEFRKCVTRYGGHYKVQQFSCMDQFLCMVFAQLSYRESLRDIEVCLHAVPSKLYHMGIRSPISRSTLAYANETRDWRIYADFAQVLIHIARPLYAKEELSIELDQTVYVLDSTTIDLCLSLFPWARFRQHKAAVKMHTLLDLRGNLPTFIIKKQLNLELSLYAILQISNVTLFEKVSILQVLMGNNYKTESNDFHNQLMLFDL